MALQRLSKENLPTITEKDLIQLVDKRIGKFARPEKIIFIGPSENSFGKNHASTVTVNCRWRGFR